MGLLLIATIIIDFAVVIAILTTIRSLFFFLSFFSSSLSRNNYTFAFARSLPIFSFSRRLHRDRYRHVEKKKSLTIMARKV